MTAPQLSVRSAKARDLAHELSRRERRPIHAIVEDALLDYAQRHPSEPAGAFLRRMRSLGGGGDDGDLAAALEENRRPHRGVEL